MCRYLLAYVWQRTIAGALKWQHLFLRENFTGVEVIRASDVLKDLRQQNFTPKH